MKKEPAVNNPDQTANASCSSSRFLLKINTFIAVVLLLLAVITVCRENRIITDHFIKDATREVEYLANQATQTIGYEELTLSDVVYSLEKKDTILYVFVLNKNNELLYYFDRRVPGNKIEHKTRVPFNDSVQRNFDAENQLNRVNINRYKNMDYNSMVYDYSLAFSSRIKPNIKGGVAIIGFSDEHKTSEIIKAAVQVFAISLVFFIISVFTTKIIYSKYY